ncbi:MAG: hypothetical protein NT154_47110 [Verrucomicrobia bacterium]|nr:hypothetical protein [Verrucomicrobiota bacterium]
MLELLSKDSPGKFAEALEVVRRRTGTFPMLAHPVGQEVAHSLLREPDGLLKEIGGHFTVILEDYGPEVRGALERLLEQEPLVTRQPDQVLTQRAQEPPSPTPTKADVEDSTFAG